MLLLTPIKSRNSSSNGFRIETGRRINRHAHLHVQMHRRFNAVYGSTLKLLHLSTPESVPGNVTIIGIIVARCENKRNDFITASQEDDIYGINNLSINKIKHN